MSESRRRPTAYVVLSFSIFAAFPAAAARLPIPNDGNWKKYFTAQEIETSEKAIGPLVERLREGGGDEKGIAEQIGAHGAAAIPALVKLCGTREMGLVAGSHGGPVLFPKHHPQCARATLALRAIKDPAAKETLLRIKDDTFLGAAAMYILLDNGGLTGPELTAMIDAPRGVRFGYNDALVNQRIMELPPDERAALLIHLLVTTGFGGASSTIVAEGDTTLKMAEFRIDQLARTPSPVAKKFLMSQMLGHIGELQRTRFESQMPTKMAWYSDEGRRKVGEKLEKLPAHIAVYEHALARCSLSMPDTSGIIIGPNPYPGLGDIQWSQTFTLPFVVWSRSSKVTITALVKGSPITDVSGQIWRSKKVGLPKGSDYPFSQIIDIRWAPTERPLVGHAVDLEVRDEAGNLYTASIYPRTLAVPELSASGTNGVESPK